MLFAKASNDSGVAGLILGSIANTPEHRLGAPQLAQFLRQPVKRENGRRLAEVRMSQHVCEVLVGLSAAHRLDACVPSPAHFEDGIAARHRDAPFGIEL